MQPRRAAPRAGDPRSPDQQTVSYSVFGGLRPWVLPARSEALGLLHHHRRQPAGPGAADVVLAYRVSELVVDQIAPVILQIGAVRLDAQAASVWR